MRPELENFRLRAATEADFPAIRSLIHQVRINPIGLAWPNFVIAEDTECQMIGCGQVKVHRDGSSELASIAVVREWRGCGVARAIIVHLLETHPKTLYLTCRTELGPFYEKFGFRIARPDELTPYFRRLHRLTGVLRFLRLMPPEGILFMVTDRRGSQST